MAGASAKTASLTVEAEINGGIYALNRFLMTLQSKRVPLGGLTIVAGEHATRVSIVLDCPPETAKRYASLLAALEDVRHLRDAEEIVEVAVLEASYDWKKSAAQAGIEAHEDDGTIVASGTPEKMESWLEGVKSEPGNVVRLGPVARPERGG